MIFPFVLVSGGYGGNGFTQSSRATEKEQRRILLLPFLCCSVSLCDSVISVLSVDSCHGRLSATYSAACSAPPIATTMNCLPSNMYVIGAPVVPAGNSVSHST